MGQESIGDRVVDSIAGPLKYLYKKKPKEDTEKRTPHQKAIDAMNKEWNDKSVEDANETFRKRAASEKASSNPKLGVKKKKTSAKKKRKTAAKRA